MRNRKMKPLPGRVNPCLNCPPIIRLLELQRHIAVGFGDAHLECEGVVLWQEEQDEFKDCLTVAEAEAMAQQWPECDWRIVMHGPMHGETYQRQGTGKWVLVESNGGFA